MTTKLKPCPFCGENKAFVAFQKPNGDYTSILPVAYAIHTYRVICDECDAYGRPAIEKSIAVDAWNTRHTDHIPDAGNMVDRAEPFPEDMAEVVKIERLLRERIKR